MTRQQKVMSMSTKLTMWVHENFVQNIMSLTYQVESFNSKECNVKYVDIGAQVNLDTRSCTCW